MAESTRSDRSHERQTGAQARLKFTPNDEDTYYELPITNVDWSRSVETEEVRHNTSLNPTLTTTGLSYSGSFEYNGLNTEALKKLMKQNSDGDIQENRPIRVTITLKEENHDTGDVERTITFKRCIVESNDREYPADGVTSTSFDFVAEDMSVVDSDVNVEG